MAEDSSKAAETGAWGVDGPKGKSAWDFLKQPVKVVAKAKGSWDRNNNVVTRKYAEQVAEITAAKEEGSEPFLDPDGPERISDGLTDEERRIKQEAGGERAKMLRNWFHETTFDDSAVRAEKAAGTEYPALAAFSKTGYGPLYEQEEIDVDKLNKDVNIRPDAWNQPLAERQAQMQKKAETYGELIKTTTDNFTKNVDATLAKELIESGSFTPYEMQLLQGMDFTTLTDANRTQEVNKLAQRFVERQTHVVGQREDDKRKKKEEEYRLAAASKPPEPVEEPPVAYPPVEDTLPDEKPKDSLKIEDVPVVEGSSVPEKATTVIKSLGRNVLEVGRAGILAAAGNEVARRFFKVGVSTERVAAIAGVVGAVVGGVQELNKTVRDKRQERKSEREGESAKKINEAIEAGATEDEVIKMREEAAKNNEAAAAEDKIYKDLFDILRSPTDKRRVLGRAGENMVAAALGAYLFLQFGPDFMRHIKTGVLETDWKEQIQKQQITPEMMRMMNWFKGLLSEGLKEGT